jgi:signal-transduction protein with cAMP-binding, CBS, and nucleotidyltransferase domain
MFPVPTHLQELTSDALTTRMRVAYLEKNIPQFKYIENNDFITSIAKKIKVLNFQMGQEIIEE